MQWNVHLSVLKLDKELPTPSRAHQGDAGLDLYARHPGVLAPGERAAVATGAAVAVPPGCVGLVVPRSGSAARNGVGVVNAPGLIDSGYRGEIRVVLINHGREVFEFARADRIAQLVIVPYAAPEIELVEHLEETERGAGGFGSSGR